MTNEERERLWQIARSYQAMTDTVKRLTPQKWLETDPARQQTLSAEITAARMAQWQLLHENGIETLLHDVARDATDPVDRALVRVMERLYRHLLPLSASDIEEMEKATASSETLWQQSFDLVLEEGPAKGFAFQQPVLQNMFDRRRAQAHKIMQDGGFATAYETTLDEWNPGLREKDIDRLFVTAASLFPQLAHDIIEARETWPAAINPFKDPATSADASAAFSSDRQLSFFISLRDMMLEAAGWSAEEICRRGVTLHDPQFFFNPFCSGTRQEAWLTIENRNNDFFTGLSNLLHETGHLLYLLSLNRLDHTVRDTPLGQFNGPGLDETSAIFFEQIGTDKEFWALITPLIKAHFGVEGPAWTPENLRRLMNNQDFESWDWYENELTLIPNMYFRTLAERDIMNGVMEPADLPAFWARTMSAMTGQAYAPGMFFAQESHWLDHYIGYFPSYWIGALSAARLHEMVDETAKAGSQNLTTYFRVHYNVIAERIFQHASLDEPMVLLERELGGHPAAFLPAYCRRLRALYSEDPAASLYYTPEELRQTAQSSLEP